MNLLADGKVGSATTPIFLGETKYPTSKSAISITKQINTRTESLNWYTPPVNTEQDAAPMIMSPSMAISDQASICHLVQSLIKSKKLVNVE